MPGAPSSRDLCGRVGTMNLNPPLCIRARLQPCRKSPIKNSGFSPGGAKRNPLQPNPAAPILDPLRLAAERRHGLLADHHHRTRQAEREGLYSRPAYHRLRCAGLFGRWHEPGGDSGRLPRPHRDRHPRLSGLRCRRRAQIRYRLIAGITLSSTPGGSG